MEEGAKYLVGTHDFRNLCKMDVCNGVVEFQRTINIVEIRLCPSSIKETSGRLAGYYSSCKKKINKLQLLYFRVPNV